MLQKGNKKIGFTFPIPASFFSVYLYVSSLLYIFVQEVSEISIWCGKIKRI